MFTVSVLPVSTLDEKAVHVDFGGGKAEIKNDGVDLATGHKWHGVYRLLGNMVINNRRWGEGGAVECAVVATAPLKL